MIHIAAVMKAWTLLVTLGMAIVGGAIRPVEGTHGSLVAYAQEEFAVRAGQNYSFTQGLGTSRIKVLGAFTAKSCCGLQTNDIMFKAFANTQSPVIERDRVVGSALFEFSVVFQGDASFRLLFDNQFHESDPSFHDKLVNLTITWMGGDVIYLGNSGGRPLLVLTPISQFFIAIGGLVSVSMLVYFLRKRWRTPSRVRNLP